MSTGELCFGFFFSLFSMGEHSVTALRAECVSAAQIAQRWKLKNISAYSKRWLYLKRVFSSCVATAETTTRVFFYLFIFLFCPSCLDRVTNQKQNQLF